MSVSYESTRAVVTGRLIFEFSFQTAPRFGNARRLPSPGRLRRMNGQASRARTPRPWQAGANQQGGAETNNAKGVRSALYRRSRSGGTAKPSGIAAKETVFRVHLIPMLGDKPLNAITTEDVQRLKLHLAAGRPRRSTTC